MPSNGKDDSEEIQRTLGSPPGIVWYAGLSGSHGISQGSRPPPQCWRPMMSKVQRDGPRGTLSVLQILPQWITSPVQKQWRKPHKVGHLLLGAGAYALDFVSFIPLNVREHVDTEGGSLMALSTCLFIVCLLSLVNQWRVRLCIHYYICKPQNGAWPCKGHSTSKWLQGAQSLFKK